TSVIGGYTCELFFHLTRIFHVLQPCVSFPKRTGFSSQQPPVTVLSPIDLCLVWALALEFVARQGGASHTKLMQPAVQQLQAKLRALLPRMSRPRCSVVMNATGRAIDWTTEPEVVIQLLCEQMIMPVRWKESMKTMGKMELDVIYECGPKKQLKALMRRIDSDLWARTVNVEV
ncbi:unnamed protein product, partial [Effrenium voratum]